MVQLRQQLSIEPMREGDVPVVQEIEKEIFSTPWPRNAYYRELASRNTAHYIVLRRDAEIIGYGGMWRGYEEGPLTPIGLRPDPHHRGVGPVLLSAPIQAGSDPRAPWA